MDLTKVRKLEHKPNFVLPSFACQSSRTTKSWHLPVVRQSRTESICWKCSPHQRSPNCRTR
eukprot:5852861-Amphidinium_carterae.1